MEHSERLTGVPCLFSAQECSETAHQKEKTVKQLAEYALDVGKQLGATYVDVRIIDQRYQFIETKDLTVAGFNQGTAQGIGIRVIAGGGWGFSSTQQLTKAAIQAAVKRAVQTARASGRCLSQPITLAPEPVYVCEWVSPHLVDPFTVSTEEKVGLLFDCARTMLAVKGVTLASGSLSFIKETKYFASSEGSRIKQTFIRSGGGIEANATDDHDRQRRTYPNSFGGQWELAGWELVHRWNLKGNAERVAEEAVQLLTAPQCPKEKRDIILGGSQLGLQIHESCGHPTELDRALGWEINFAGFSFLTPDKLNQLQYGSPIVNLVADATEVGGLGSFGFDDEGVQSRQTYLVKNGVFSGYLSSRDTAHLIGLEASGGCMRAESYAYAPIIRMTNISLLPGSAGTLEDLIAQTEDGIYFDTNKSWSIDSRRYNFQFSVEAAWEIKNGKRVRLLKNASYSGITPEFWNSCDAICGPSEYVNWGLPNCGKGQPMQTMWTGHGAAPARFKNVQVGIATA